MIFKGNLALMKIKARGRQVGSGSIGSLTGTVIHFLD